MRRAPLPGAGLLLAAGLLCTGPVHGAAQAPRPEVPALYGQLEFRSIGPAVVGGRVHDVEALPFDHRRDHRREHRAMKPLAGGVRTPKLTPYRVRRTRSAFTV